MSQEWGRNEYAGEWPNRHPLWRYAVIFLALVSMAAVCVYRYAEVWTPLQQFYTKAYIRSGVKSVMNFAKSDRYQMLTVIGKKGSHWAFDEEVMQVKTTTGETTLALTPEAIKLGDLRLVLQEVQCDNGKLYEFLGHWVYRDQTLTDLLRPGLWGGLGVFLVGLIVAIPKDAARARVRKEGRRLKGPELVTVRAFNRRNRSDGIGFELTERTLKQRLFGQVPRLKLPRAM